MYSPLKIEHIGTVEYGVLHIHESSMSTESRKMLGSISYEIRFNLPKLKIRFYDIDLNENNITNKKII